MKKTGSVVDIESYQDQGQAKPKRLSVLKTYKMYVDGKFPRSESERYYVVHSANGDPLANVCKASRKDFRDALSAARKAQSSWAGRSAYNRGQILYRIAEMLEGRRAQFVEELTEMGAAPREAVTEVESSIDRLVYYAGWADKYQQVFSSVNPVNSNHFNFSVYEPTGVVTIFCPENFPLLAPVSVLAPAIVGGNAVILVASESKPLCSITLGEVLSSSDVPAGVVNILTKQGTELISPIATHMDLNAIMYAGSSTEELKEIELSAALNVKRISRMVDANWLSPTTQNPYLILDTQEVKTTWHPIGV